MHPAPAVTVELFRCWLLRCHAHLFQPMNFVDFLAILPYVLSALIESMQDLHILGKAGKIMRLVRVMRILRIFKLVRHFAGLQSLIYTLKQVCRI